MRLINDRKAEAAETGTYIDRYLPRSVQFVFVVVILVLILIPLVGMLWAPTESTTENRTLANYPEVQTEDGSFNENYLEDLGTYFDDHFAYRNEAVDANAHLRALVGTSATDQVVIGTDGWLFYGGTLPDYLGQSVLSDRALANIAHNLALGQHYVESRDASFVFTLAPNKNSLDWSNMPYYYLRFEGASNAERLKPYLAKAGVNYVDLFTFFEERMEREDGFHYLKEDSHWDNEWALLAANELLTAVDHERVAVDPRDVLVRDVFEGDLQSMLYPSTPSYEDNQYYVGYNDEENETGSLWTYVEGSDVTDNLIRTTASSQAHAQGSLLLFRDSFGNALLPFCAASFETATFSKLIPYNLLQLEQNATDYVMVERAERHLSYLATDPPIMINPYFEGIRVPSTAHKVGASSEVSQNGSLWMLAGVVEEALSPETNLYVTAQLPDGSSFTFVPFWTSIQDEDGDMQSDDGFLVYAPSSIDLSEARVSVYAS